MNKSDGYANQSQLYCRTQMNGIVNILCRPLQHFIFRDYAIGETPLEFINNCLKLGWGGKVNLQGLQQ